MKFVWISFKVLLFVTIVLCINNTQGCKDPDEFAPPQDSLSPPPNPPQLIVPADSELFSQTPGIANDIYFEWSSITDAEFYQIQVAYNISFTSVLHDYKAYTHSAKLTFYTVGEYFWHVRAYSSKWTWYTDWSDARYFWSTAAF